MKKLNLFALSIFTLITTLLTSAIFNNVNAEVTAAEFNAAYKQYSTNLSNNAEQSDLAVESLALYKMSESLSGKQHANTILLLNSAANHYRNAGQLEEAIKHYDATLSLIEGSELESTPSHINLLIEILDTKGITLSRDRTELSEQLYKMVKRLYEETDSEQSLFISLVAFSTMIENEEIGVKFSRLNRFATDLISKAQEVLPPTSVELVRAQFNQGILLQSMKKNEDAIDAFVKIVDVVSASTDFTHPYEIAAHSRLVNLFENEGDSEAATEHCLAIGKMTPWQDDIKPTPLFRLPPTYPKKMASYRKEGWVLMSFDISPYGFVQNVVVEDSSHQGFEQASIAALEKWRYAPKFENGEATTAEGMRVQLDFVFRDNKRNFKNI